MKYKISDSKEDCIVYNGHELHRIIALETLGEVNCGDKGGYIENEGNLSHNGRAWVFDDAKVYENAIVRDNARVVNDSMVFGHAIVFGNSMVVDFAKVSGFATVAGNCVIESFAYITDHAGVSGNAIVSENSRVIGYAKVSGNANVRGFAIISDHASVRGNALIAEHAFVTGVAEVSGPAIVIGNAFVRLNSDYIVFKNWWSSGRYFTWTRSNNMYNVGCFYGSGEELIKKAYSDFKESGDNYKAIVDYVNNVVLNKK